LNKSVELMAPRPAPPSQNWALAPMLSGARARGFADGLEWLGLAAALIDDRGEVLHLNAGAIELLGDNVYVEASRLRAADPALDASISEAILETLMTGATTEFSVTSSRGFHVRVIAVEPAGDDLCQLLRAVAIFERVGRA
jgi:hypothetical protein